MSQAGIYINSSGPGSIVETLTGNTGGAVGPTGNNINVVGSGNITVTGNPGTSTLTISETVPSTITFDTDSGSATPTLGVIEILGGSNVTTSGSGNTVTIDATLSPMAPAYTLVTTSPYVVSGSDYYLSVDTSVIPITVQLPNAPTNYQIFIIKDKSGTAGIRNITVTTVGGVVTIDGATSQVLNTNYESIEVLFDGANYQIF